MRSIIVFAGLVLGAAGLIGNYLQQPAKPAAAKSPPPAAAVAANAPASAAPSRVSIGRDHRGHFQANGRVDGRQVSFMVDTGASVIALTERDADRLGIRPSRSAFTAAVQTANGTVRAAPVTLNSVDIGGLVVRDVRALVVPGGALNENLLGLSYLTRLKRFEFADNRLVLEK
jgi:aspartyl protease family protein